MNQSASGVKTWRLKAPQASIELSGAARLSSPEIFFFKEGKQVSSAKSRQATVQSESKDMSLIGDVVITSMKDNSTLKTTLLNYTCATRRFTTEEPVTLIRPGAVIHGKGMDANSDLSEINIHHQETSLQ